MPQKTVHIIGAGLSGLAAATALAQQGWRALVYEAGPQAGGRCRSYFDAQLGCRIDNGNHLMLSGNRQAMQYIGRIGAKNTFEKQPPLFPFIDLATEERWTLKLNRGRIPWWMLLSGRRVPGTGLGDYLAALKLNSASAEATVDEVLDNTTSLFHRLWEPFAVSALNTKTHEGSARLLGAVIKESLGAGGAACCPMLPKLGLSESLIDPALAYIAARGGAVHLKQRVHRLGFENDRVTTLDFGAHQVSVGSDMLVLASPAPVAASLVPGLTAPTEHRAIVNLHYRIDPPTAAVPFIGIIGGTAEWLFAKPGILSVTISAADALVDADPDRLAETVWQELRRIYALPETLPPARVVKEKRATFAATPAEDKRRPQAQTRWKNLFLAGDWTQTGLPSTIEGSIRSGHRVAEIIKNT
jgi:squalene-associated FAD-dependent desaturase